MSTSSSTASTTLDTSSFALLGSASKKKVQCVLDPSLVNGDSLPLMSDVGLSIFASACSKNRGAFVLQPPDGPDGKTYGCLALPSNVLDLLGISDEIKKLTLDSSNSTNSTVDDATNSTTTVHTFKVDNAEAIMKHYKDGNLTSTDAVELLNFIVENVYHSTPNVELTPYACDVNGLVKLECDSDSSKKTSETTPIRAVTLAGVFTPALWATDGKELTLDEAAAFYTHHDFKEMKKLGLNTVQVPVPTKMFSEDHPPAAEWKDLLVKLMDLISAEGLDVILMLEQGDSRSEDIAQPVETAAAFAQDYNLNTKQGHPVILAFTLPAMDTALLEAAKKAAPDLPLWIPTKGGDFTRLHNYPDAVGASLELTHTATIGDIASSSSQEDRGKLFYHESTACIARAPLEYSDCFQDVPVMVASGFDLAIDDCHLRDISPNFKDYGQCDRFNETVDSPWWKDHRYSFAARQLFAYERGQGWSFATWKLYGTDPESLGILSEPAKLLALKEVVAAGVMPSLTDMDEPIVYPLGNNSSPVGLACLNPPVNDFVLGDATLAPTPAPPPSCGNGWWNFTTEQCDYWIPPTAAPTPPCPVCSNDTIYEPLDCPPVDGGNNTLDVTTAPLAVQSGASQGGVAVKSFFAGALVAFVISGIVFTLITSKSRKRNEYEPVPNGNGYGANGNGHSYQGA